MALINASEIFRGIDRELWLITAQTSTRRGGLIATFVSQASLPTDLPRVSVGVAKQHHTWSLIEESHAFGLHLLSEEQIEWVWRFGLQSGRDVDKLEGLPFRNGLSGCPLLAGVPAWLECRVETQLDTGDRTVYLAEVIDAGREGVLRPLTTQAMLRVASDDQRRELLAQMQHDSAVDAEAIRGWRQARVQGGA